MQTHTNEKKTQSLYWTLAAVERDKLGVRVRWVPDRRRGGMLHDAAPDESRWSDPQSHVGDSRLVAEFGWRIIGVHGGGGGSGSLCPSLWRASRDTFAATMALCSTLVTAKTPSDSNVDLL